MRQAAALIAGGVLAFGAVGCGDDEPPEPIAPQPTVPTVPPRTVHEPVPEPSVPPTPGPPPGAVQPPLGVAPTLGPEDVQALDTANRAVAEYCDSGSNARAVGGGALENRLNFGVEAFLDVLRRQPDAIFAPPDRPEHTRDVRTVVEEAAVVLRSEECALEEAGRLEAALGQG